MAAAAGLIVVAGLSLVELNGLNGQTIYVNPQTITSVRTPTPEEHMSPKVNCIVYTGATKFGVINTCKEVVVRLRV